MDNYLDLLPQELINVISLYLDYTETSILEQEFNFRVDYQLLLTERYPAFSKIIKSLKETDIKWKSYPYDRAYDLITLIENYIKFEIEDSKTWPDINIGTHNTIEFLEFIFDCNLMIGDMHNILSSYNILVEKKDEYLKKYKILFPNIKDKDIILNSVYEDHYRYSYSYGDNYLDYIITHFNRSKGAATTQPLISLYIIFIYVVEHLDTLDQYKDKIFKINPNQEVTDKFVPYNEQFLNIKIVYRHIIQFIKAQEKYQKDSIVKNEST